MLPLTLILLAASGLATDPTPAAAPVGTPVSPAPMAMCGESLVPTATWDCPTCRSPFESDRAFNGFIGPISNPVLAKDPRSLTEARFLFIQNWIPDQNPALGGGGEFQVVAMQARVALTERLTFIADKDGYAFIQPGTGQDTDGWLNLAAGLKYTFIRDVENQFLAAGGFMYEPQTGESSVFQGHGDGLFTFFGTAGKEFACCYHAIGNVGYQLPVDGTDNSSFLYASLHLDRELFGWLYPVVELNWFHWLSGGNRGIPSIVGEGDGLINLGTSGVAGNDLVTLAFGLKARLSDSLETGAVYEFPISNREDFISGRIIAELILRY